MAEEPEESFLFTYVAPLVGVLLVAIGIAAAVPGAYAMIQSDIAVCGTPTISVDLSEQTQERFGGQAPAGVTRLQFDELSAAEQEAFKEALNDSNGEAHLEGEFPHRPQFENGTLVRYQGESYYTYVVSENPCFAAAPLQFPLGLFAIAFGTIAILTPPLYRKLVEIERQAE